MLNPFIFVGMPRHVQAQYKNRNTKYVINIVSEVTGVSAYRISSKERSANVVQARILLSHFLYNYSKLTLVEIGSIIRRDHSTVVYQLKIYHDRYETERAFKYLSDKIRGVLG